MQDSYPHVFSPFRLGGFDLRNRLVALPAGTSLVEGGVPTHADMEHFERLARGGVGLVIAGAMVVHPTTALRSGKLVEGYLDAVVPAMKEKADACTATVPASSGSWSTSVVSSSAASPTSRRWRRPRSRRRATPTRRTSSPSPRSTTSSRAGGSRRRTSSRPVSTALRSTLPTATWSASSCRHSPTGGPTASAARSTTAMRFLHLVIDAMRSVSPAGFALGVRLSGEEEIPGGMGIEDCVRISEDLAALGVVDYFSITHGTRGSYVKDSTGPDAVAVPSASRVRAATGVPTLVGQRIRDVDTAEHAIKAGHADLVGMARALIADPDLPVKSQTGRLEEIRGCLGINQDCRAFDPHLHCAVNAEVGRVRPASVGVQVSRAKEIYVIGGGPAGLEAARVSAERGHRVTLFERDTALGGAVRVAAASPHRATLIDIVDYLDRETRRLKVDINLGAQIAPDDLEEIRGFADHVVLATGSRVAKLPPGPRSRGAVSVDDVLTGHLPRTEPGSAVVYDEGDGFWPAYSAAEALAQRGWEVTLRDRPDRSRRARAPRERRPAAGAARGGGRDDAGGHPAGGPGGPDRAAGAASRLRRRRRPGRARAARLAPATHRRRRAHSQHTRRRHRHGDRRLRDPAADRPCRRRGLPARGDRLMRTHPAPTGRD